MEKYLTYNHDNGKTYRIPREFIDKAIKNKIAENEPQAIWIWLEDNGIVETDEETLELEKKAKANRITATIHQARKDTAPTKRKVERKVDETKESLISSLAEMLTPKVQNLVVVNVGKLIEFDLNGEHYKLDLIKQRKPKAK